MLTHNLHHDIRTLGPLTLLAALALATAAPLGAVAQPASPNHAAHQAPSTAPAAKSLADEVAELKSQVAKLQTALQQGHGRSMPGGAGMTSGNTTGPAPTGGAMGSAGQMGAMGRSRMPMGQMGMGGMSGGQGGGMGMMDMHSMMQGMMGGMGSMAAGGGGMPMPGAGGGMAGMEREMMGMMGMAPGNGMAMSSALPGFPGASHLYHVGATGFFLDHGEHITLTTEQQTALGRAREKALMDKDAAERKVEASEQELWTLTAADQPDATKIEAKVREVERLRGDQRLSFIRAVGEAAKLLTDEQRRALVGTMAPPQAAPGAGGGMGGMGDM